MGFTSLFAIALLLFCLFAVLLVRNAKRNAANTANAGQKRTALIILCAQAVLLVLFYADLWAYFDPSGAWFLPVILIVTLASMAYPLYMLIKKVPYYPAIAVLFLGLFLLFQGMLARLITYM